MILNSGKRLEMGETTQSHMQRFLSAAPEWVITGITGTTGDVMGKLQLTQLGLVQAQQPDVADYSMMPYRTRLPFRPLQEFLWEEEYSHILGQSIREHPGLRLVGGGLLKSQGYLHRDLIMHGALIWAKDVGELRALRRLSACIVFGGKAMDRSEGGAPLPRDIHHLCGMSAEHEPASGLARRTIGLEGAVSRAGLKCADRYEHFDIDGPGGEVVTEVEFSLSLHPRAIKVSPMAYSISNLIFVNSWTTPLANIHFKDPYQPRSDFLRGRDGLPALAEHKERPGVPEEQPAGAGWGDTCGGRHGV